MRSSDRYDSRVNWPTVAEVRERVRGIQGRRTRLQRWVLFGCLQHNNKTTKAATSPRRARKLVNGSRRETRSECGRSLLIAVDCGQGPGVSGGHGLFTLRCHGWVGWAAMLQAAARLR